MGRFRSPLGIYLRNATRRFLTDFVGQFLPQY
jgi:hypothetical protein